jgi:hypothetical protein
VKICDGHFESTRDLTTKNFETKNLGEKNSVIKQNNMKCNPTSQILVSAHKKIKEVASKNVKKLESAIESLEIQKNNEINFCETVPCINVVIGGCHYSICYSSTKYHQNKILGSLGEYFVIQLLDHEQALFDPRSGEKTVIFQTNNLWYQGPTIKNDDAIFIEPSGTETDSFEKVFGAYESDPGYPEFVLSKKNVLELSRKSCPKTFDVEKINKSMEEHEYQLRAWKNTLRTGFYHCYCGKPTSVRKSNKTKNYFHGCVSWFSGSPKYPTDHTSGCGFTKDAEKMELSKNVITFY